MLSRVIAARRLASAPALRHSSALARAAPGLSVAAVRPAVANGLLQRRWMASAFLDEVSADIAAEECAVSVN